jgi:hypothetical protein
MEQFNPAIHVIGSSAILEANGTWPSFYEASVYSFNFWRGVLHPKGKIWVTPIIEATIEFRRIELPFAVDFRFEDCNSIEMSYFNYDNNIEDLTFSFEERGFYADGVTPLPPHICVNIGQQGHTVALTFKCFKVEIIARREIKESLDD